MTTRRILLVFAGAALSLILVLVAVACTAAVRYLATPTKTQALTSMPTLAAAPAPTATTMASASPVASGGPLDARQIADAAAERMSAVQTFHFSLLPSGAPMDVGAYMDSPMAVTLTGVEGDVARPDQLQAQIQVSSFGLTMEVGLVKVGGVTYMSDPLMGAWEQLPAETSQDMDLAVLFDADEGLPAMLSRSDSTLVGIEDVDDQPAYHLRLANDQALIPDTQGATTVDMWVDQASFLVRRMLLVGVDAQGQSVIWQIDLSAFDQPVNIQPPV